MSSSISRARSLRKPTQGSSSDLPSTSGAAPSQRPVSPSRLPAPRPTIRAVSGGSIKDTAAKKKKPSAISTLLTRTSSTRPPAPTTTTTARQRDASVGSGPPSAPLTRSATAASSGLSKTTSAKDSGLTRTRHPASSSTNTVSSGASSKGNTTTNTATATSTRPTTSGGLPPQKRSAGAPAGSGHTRARSVATLNGSTVLRPPSQTSSTTAPRPRPTSLYGAPAGSSSSSTTTRSRPTSAATDRLASSKPATTSSSSSSTIATRPSRASSNASKQPPKPTLPARQQQASPTSPPRNKPVLRPAFSTLQQHYSPAKSLAPKPLTATYLAPPSPSKLPTNVALSAETARLQTELLQLHLLHRDLPPVTAAWHASARSKLAARHAGLAASSKDLASLEADAAERLNVAALQKWGSDKDGGGRGVLEERIQRLDALLTALWALDSPGGKHNRLVRAFERWASSLTELEAARARADDADPSALLDSNLEVRFGGGLDARWKEDSSALVRRLEGWETQLRDLEFQDDEASQDQTQVSSLKRMLDGCGSLIKDMLGELAVMEEIEKAAVERETEWIRKMNREGDDGHPKDTPRAGAVWRIV